MFHCRKQEALKAWMAAVKGSGLVDLKRFVKRLASNFWVFQTALLYYWSNGVTEGNVNCLKMIKRSMFGRANFDLLSAKVLYRP